MKPKIRAEFLEVKYGNETWGILRSLRKTASSLMEALKDSNLNSIVYGSIARGDVSSRSDVDVFAYDASSSVAVELALERAGIKPVRRVLVQATPSYAPKAYFEISDNVSVSMPLVKLRKVEREFYRFAGEIDLEELVKDVRKPGVDKRLMLIEPTEMGHVESSIIGRESYVARLLGISFQTVLDRVRTLTKRDKVGRTGLFLERNIPQDRTFESVIEELSATNPALRRRLAL